MSGVSRFSLLPKSCVINDLFVKIALGLRLFLACMFHSELYVRGYERRIAPTNIESW